MRSRFRILPALLLAAAACARTPEERAVAYLSREVRDWRGKNGCFSCHNNGDAARALFEARRRAVPFDQASLAETAAWLARPEAWKENGPAREYNDRRLASLQFAFALASADEAPPDALRRAAEALRDLQEPDGSWSMDAGGLAGSPVTYGRTLATVVARRVLRAGGAAAFSSSLERAEAWLAGRRPASVVDAAALLLGPADEAQRRACLEILRKGQAADGGWGPYVTSPPEVFDTALALLALAPFRGEPGIGPRVRSGRKFLLAQQLGDGSWPETTRPPGVESYAHRISTSGWATLALLATSHP